MMNFSIKQLDQTCLVIVVVVSLIGGYLAFSHVTEQKQQFGIEKDILSKRMKEVNLAATSLGELKTALADTKKELNYLNELIPEAGKIGLLLKQIDAIMKQREVALISLRPLSVRQEEVYLRNPIQLVFNGKFVNIYHLIRDLEGMNRMVVMEKMVITRQADSDQCKVVLMISVFEHAQAI
jgi:Tfp pilus assembly protein PilO